MNSYEPASVVFTRLQTLDPDNASKIMGYILLQDPNEHELMRIARSSDANLHSLILDAKSYLRLSSNTPPVSPFSSSASNPNSKNPFSTRSSSSSAAASRFMSSNPSSPSSSTWLPNGAKLAPSPSSLSYAAVVNGSNGSTVSSSNGMMSVLSGGNPVENTIPLVDDASSFDCSTNNDYFLYNNNDMNDSNSNSHQNLLYHRRSLSLSDVGLGNNLDENSSPPAGFGGWRPCMYFARGHCKNGSACNFSHTGGFVDSGSVEALGSPNGGFEHELLRSKAAAHRQRLAVASQLMGGGGNPFPYHKASNFLNDSPRSLAASLVVGDEFNKFGRFRFERNDFPGMGFGATSPGSRQIYLTFPADSTFREDDVSNYFSTFGPVQDVRIPYQAKRMFGFVTFVYPETVEQILSKGNPHFVCDSRVLVKPYKEKGKVDKKQHQFQQLQLERPELSTCLSPHGDTREPFDVRVGPRMFYSAQEMLIRRKLEEQADLQHAIELQGRKMMNLQLLDLKNHALQRNHSFQLNMPPITTVSSPTQPYLNQKFAQQMGVVNQETPFENGTIITVPTHQYQAIDGLISQEGDTDGHEINGSDHSSSKEDRTELSYFDLSLENILPDNLFGSPRKSASEQQTIFNSASLEDEVNHVNSGVPSSTGSLNMPSLASCFFEMPRFSSGHGVVEM